MLQHDPCIVKLQVGSFNEVLGIFIDSWSALDSGERDKYSQEATQPPPPTDFHRQRLFILRPVSAVFCFLREGFGGSRTTSPDLRGREVWDAHSCPAGRPKVWGSDGTDLTGCALAESTSPCSFPPPSGSALFWRARLASLDCHSGAS